MVDYDECEWSLCSPYALLLSLLSWYGEDLSLKCRRGSCFSCGAVSEMVSKCQVHPIPHGGSFDLFHECPKYCGDRITHRAIVLSTFHESPVA